MVLCASVTIFCVKLVVPIGKISFAQLIPACTLAISDMVRWDQEHGKWVLKHVFSDWLLEI